MWLVRLALRRAYTVATLCILIVMMGGLAITRMRTDIFPSIDIPVVIVVWNYPGLPADDMERRIVFLTERAFSTTVDGIQKIESQSIPGTGIVKVYFEPGQDIGGAIAQITSSCLAVSRIMPPGITPPAVLRLNASNVMVAQLSLASDRLSELQQFDYALNFIRLQLFTIPGLSSPLPYGGAGRVVSVDIDPERVAAKGLSPPDVVAAITQGNVIIPAGTARMGGTEYDVQLNSSPLSLAEFNRIPIRVVNGTTVYVGDVANVHDGNTPQTNVVRVNGRRSTFLAVIKKEGASTLAVVDAAKEMIPKIKATAPEGLEVKLDFDQSVFVRAAIAAVLKEALISTLLVALMVLGFLGSWRSVVIICASIPLSTLCGVIGLFLTGNTLNIMTLGGMALAIGMLVDDATVEIENIHRNRHHAPNLTRAVLDSAQQVAMPAIAATSTICIVFFPVVLLTGPARYLFTPLALAVVFSMVASYLLSRTLVTTLSDMLLGKDPHDLGAPSPGRTRRTLWQSFNHRRDQLFNRFEGGYAAALGVALAHRRLALVTALLVVCSGGLLASVVGMDFFPSVDAGNMKLHVRAPVGTRLEDSEALVAHVEKAIRDTIPEKDLGGIVSNIGLPNSFNLAFVPSDNVGSQDTDILISLKEGHAPTADYRQKLRDRLPNDFPGTLFYFQPADVVSQVLNFGVSAPVDVQVSNRNSDAAYGVARKIANQMKQVAGTRDVRIAQIMNHPALYMTVDRERAARMGVNMRDVASSLLTSLSSSSLLAPSFWVNPENNVNYTVAAQTPTTKFEEVSDLMATPLGGQGAEQTHNSAYLGSIADMSATTTRSLINHSMVQPVIDVQCNVENRDLGGVAKDLQAIVDHMELPKNTTVKVLGQSESMFTSFRALALGLVIAIALVYLVLVVLFQSWLDPFIILMAIPGALTGVLWMLAVTGTTINIESLMGSIMVVGISASNSILLVSFANQARVSRPELTPLSAALEAGRTRLRPVLMTALAMILGMLPMALAIGEGGEQNAPLGRAVIGGLLVATGMTLFVVPVVYSLLRRDIPNAHLQDERFHQLVGEEG